MSDPVREGYRIAAERFQSALTSGVPVVTRCYSIGGLRARVRVVGPALAEAIRRPWSHLEEPDAAQEPGELAVDLWHETETGIDAPAVHDEIDPLSRFPLRVSHDDRFLGVRQPQTAAWLDREQNHLVGAIGDVARRALYESGRPLEMPLLVWLRDRGIPLVHAGFVARGDRGALILGRSGSGKSTLAAECLCAGFAFLSDDKVAFVPRALGEPMGWSLNSSLHLDARALARLPALAGHAVAPRSPIDDKYQVPVQDVAADRLRRSVGIHLLLIPTLSSSAPPALAGPVSKKEALLALSLSTLLALPIAGACSLGDLAVLAETIPAYVVRVTAEPDVPGRLAALLEETI